MARRSAEGEQNERLRRRAWRRLNRTAAYWLAATDHEAFEAVAGGIEADVDRRWRRRDQVATAASKFVREHHPEVWAEIKAKELTAGGVKALPLGRPPGH